MLMDKFLMIINLMDKILMEKIKILKILMEKMLMIKILMDQFMIKIKFSWIEIHREKNQLNLMVNFLMVKTIKNI